MKTGILILGLVLLSIVASGCVENEPPKTVPAQIPIKIQQAQTTIAPVTETASPSPTEPPQTTAPPAKEVAYLEFTSFSTLKQWDADANLDGVETTIYPHSADGGDIKTDGTVIFILYQNKMDETTFKEYTVKLQEWREEITKDEGGFAGVTRRLEFDDKTEKIVAREDFFTGELHAKLITPEGKEFETKTNVM